MQTDTFIGGDVKALKDKVDAIIALGNDIVQVVAMSAKGSYLIIYKPTTP